MSGSVSYVQENVRIPPLRTTFKQKKPVLKSSYFPSVVRKTTHLPDVQKIEDTYAQIQHNISFIEDPLWKHICKEVIHIMGPISVLKIWDIQLGDLSPHDQEAELYCPTIESAQFVQQYDFVILGSLQKFFPVVRALKVKIGEKVGETFSH
jgi:hypothetical protein